MVYGFFRYIWLIFGSTQAILAGGVAHELVGCVWDKDATAEIFFSSVLCLEKLALSWPDFNTFFLNRLSTIQRRPRFALKLNENIIKSSKFGKANSSLTSNKQFFIKHWNSAGVFVRLNGTLTHSQRPHGVMKSVKGCLSLSKYIWWNVFFCSKTGNNFFLCKHCQKHLVFVVSDVCLEVFEFSDL